VKTSAIQDTSSDQTQDTMLSRDTHNCKEITLALMKHRYAWPFNIPVDPISLGIPDYFDVIKYPMDFGTVLEHLKKDLYNGVEEFAEDIRLVFSNALSYNTPGSDVFLMAQTLAELFEKLFTQYGYSNVSPEYKKKKKEKKDKKDKKHSVNTDSESKMPPALTSSVIPINTDTAMTVEEQHNSGNSSATLTNTNVESEETVQPKPITEEVVLTEVKE